MKTVLAMCLSLGLGLLAASVVFAAEECTDCHGNILNRPNLHEGAVMDCTACHFNHSETPNPKLPHKLRDKVSNLCASCHDLQAITRGGHPVAGHPTQLARDPMFERPGVRPREFNCISCHNPHSTEMKGLFRYNVNRTGSPYRGNSCSVCHWEHMFPGKAPFPPVE